MSPVLLLSFAETARSFAASSSRQEEVGMGAVKLIGQGPGSSAISIGLDVAPSSPADLERLRPPKLLNAEVNGSLLEPIAIDIVPSLHSPSRNKWRLASGCGMFLSQSLSDSAPEALVPYIEQQFHIGYAMVSLIFVANAVGLILAAPLTHRIESRFGRSITAIICQVLLFTGYLIVVRKTPFPAIVFSFFFDGTWGSSHPCSE